MSFESLINLRNCRVTRNTSVLLEAIQITPNPVVDRQPPREACLSIKISGCTTGSGVVIVNGTVAGGSETFSFSANDVIKGIKEFTSITSITTAGFIDEATVGNIEIKAVTPTNQPIYTEIEIFAAMPAWLDLKRGGITIVLPGAVVQSISKLFCGYAELTPILENDIIYWDEKRYRVDFVWSSPPCPTHSKLVQTNKNKMKVKYPDMTLYQEILFLKLFLCLFSPLNRGTLE